MLSRYSDFIQTTPNQKRWKARIYAESYIFLESYDFFWNGGDNFVTGVALLCLRA